MEKRLKTGRESDRDDSDPNKKVRVWTRVFH